MSTEGDILLYYYKSLISRSTYLLQKDMEQSKGGMYPTLLVQNKSSISVFKDEDNNSRLLQLYGENDYYCYISNIKDELVIIAGKIVKLKRLYINIVFLTRNDDVSFIKMPFESEHEYLNVGWIITENIECCMVCAKTFGTHDSKHHCKACGNVVCNGCGSTNSIIMELKEIQRPLRTCTLCNWGQDFVESIKRNIQKKTISDTNDFSSFDELTKRNLFGKSSMHETNALSSNNEFDDIDKMSKLIKKNKENFELTRYYTLMLISNVWFERLILFVIIVSSSFMALADYSHVNSSNNLVEQGSIRNTILIQSELVFIIIFTIEFLLKLFALGYDSYFANRWNWLDFLIVVVSLFSLIPEIPDLRVLRTFRVLRPLKSLKAIPGVAVIVVVFIKSLPPMGDILLLILFFVFMFAIIGLQLYQGPFMHTRCRLTPFPVNYSWSPNIYSSINSTYLESMDLFRCLNVPNFDYPDQDPSMTQSSSPWNINCYWPIDTNDSRLCSLDGTGTHLCANGIDYNISVNNWRWCGSNYDGLGNARFDPSTAYLETYTPYLEWSYINFDNIGYSIIFVIQNISGDNLSTLQSMISDSIGASSVYIYCNLIVIIGTFFLLQLNIAILEIIFSSQLEEKQNKPININKNKENVKLTIFRSNKSEQESSNDTLDDEIDGIDLDIESSPLQGTEMKVLEKSNESSKFSKAKSNFLQFYGQCITKLKVFIDNYDKPNESCFRRGCAQLNKSIYFQYFFSVMILLNTLVLAWDHEPIAQSTLDLLDFFSFLLTLIFTIEFLISLFGLGKLTITSNNLGINAYFRTSFKTFEALIVFTSLLEIVISPLPAMISGNAVSEKKQLTVVRIFRVFRLMRLFRSKIFKKVLLKMIAVVYTMFDFLVLLNLILFILALIGMGFFANYFRFDANGFVLLPVYSPAWINAPDRPRSNFDTFTLSFMTVFQCFTIDNWTDVMFNAGRAVGSPGMIFPIFCYTFGSIFIMNLFLAMLIKSFNDGDEEKSRFDAMKDPIIDTEIVPIMPFLSWPNADSDIDSDDDFDNAGNKIIRIDNKISEDKNNKNNNIMAKCISATQNVMKKISFITKNYSTEIISHYLFDPFILLVTILSSVSLALDNPLNNPESDLMVAIFYIDVITSSFFVMEMILKMTSMGIYSSKMSYFRDGWNVLDFVVLMFSFLSLGGLSQFKSLKALRALRPLRLINRIPGLKVIVTSIILSGPQILQIGVVVLLSYIIFGILFVSFLKGQLRGCSGSVYNKIVFNNDSYNSLLVSPLSYYSLSPEQQTWFGPNSPVYVSNSFNNCSQAWPQQPCCANYVGVSDADINSKIICECWGGSWATLTDFRFDNLGAALLTLFDDATVNNWTENMYLVSDSTGIYMQPIRDNSPIWCWVFYVFTLFGSFFALQLFVGSITFHFDECRQKLGHNIFLTKEQQDWSRTRRIITAIRPNVKIVKPSNWFRQICYSIAFSSYFEASMNFIIVAQCIFLSISYFQMSDFLSNFISRGQITLAIMFAVEMMIKLIGLGPVGYAQDNWNILDSIIVLASIGALIGFEITGNNNGLIINLVRVLRVVRLFRLLKGYPSMQKLINTIIMTIPGVINVAILLFLLVYIFALICMNFYAKTMYNGSYDQDSNFRSFGLSFVTLMRLLTGDDWGQFMYDIVYDNVNCVDNPPYNPSYCGFNDKPGCIPLNGCGGWAIIPIMLIYMIFMTLILLSVVISVIISTYNDVNESLVSPDDFEAFSLHWAEYDPEANCYIPYELLFSFVATLFLPFGFEGQIFSRRQYYKRVRNIKVDANKRVHFQDVIHELSISLYERSIDPNSNITFHNDEIIGIKDDIKRISKRLFKKCKAFVSGKPYKKKKNSNSNQDYTVGEYLAVQFISEMWLKRLKRKTLQEENNVLTTSPFYNKNKIIETNCPSKAWKRIMKASSQRPSTKKNRDANISTLLSTKTDTMVDNKTEDDTLDEDTLDDKLNDWNGEQLVEYDKIHDEPSASFAWEENHYRLHCNDNLR